MEMELEMDEGENGAEGKLAVLQGGEHLTLEVLNAIGQVMENTSYGAVYKAKLNNGGAIIALRLLREGNCKDPSSCSLRHPSVSLLNAPNWQ
ncbi:hypothetical protein J5N97_018304 [Dioscorea zingiberensis]|uniref:Uncharacterized protein n=1 Tax=Dioscorea zingiberensis TaxID=325984 RepID=A0A9D5HH68_9LILI|nr:hypothetical protein J5N97_018304 [Dioscorea zingiberensis]